MKVRLLLAVAGALVLACPATAGATASSEEIKRSDEAGVTYLRSQQSASGAFAGFGGEWALSALSSAGVPPAEVKAGASGTDARSYYRELVGDPESWPGESSPPVTDFENAALAAYAAGIDPARVSADQNLIAQIVARYDTGTPGYYGEPGFLNGTIFALLTLADARTEKGVERVPAALLEPSIAALRANQHTDGGWTYVTAAGDQEALEAPAEAEFTGAAMAALCGAGVPTSDPAIKSGEHFLAGDLAAEAEGSGAFATEFGPNTDSDAWAVEGLNACGLPAQSVELTTSHGNTPIDFLISQQLGGGGFRYEAAETSPNLYSSQDGLRALAGGGFTALPPRTHHGIPRWVAQASFEPGVAAELTVIVDGAGSVKPCAVTVTPTAATTTLLAVLQAAKAAGTPAGCVTGFTPESGKGKVTAIDGQTEAGGWEVATDGGRPGRAKTSTKVKVGATLLLTP